MVELSDTMVSVDWEWLQLSLEEECSRLRPPGSEKRARERTEAGLEETRLQRLSVRTLLLLSAMTSTMGGRTALGMILDMLLLQHIMSHDVSHGKQRALLSKEMLPLVLSSAAEKQKGIHSRRVQLSLHRLNGRTKLLRSYIQALKACLQQQSSPYRHPEVVGRNYIQVSKASTLAWLVMLAVGQGASPSAGGAPWWALEPLLLFFFFLLPRSQLKAQRRLEEPDLGFFFFGAPCAEGTSPFSCPPAGSQVPAAAAGASCERLPDISGQGRMGRRKPRFTGRARLGYAPPGGAADRRELPMRGGGKRLPSPSPVPHAGAPSPVRPSSPLWIPGSRAPASPLGPPHLPRDSPRALAPPGTVLLLRVRSAPGCTRRQGSSRGKFLPDGRACVGRAGPAERAGVWRGSAPGPSLRLPGCPARGSADAPRRAPRSGARAGRPIPARWPGERGGRQPGTTLVL
ncbi:translation initiation factor IF-2-like [Chelonia mydas]|uniref:translation initiation factor IF-2-like n=1 Tax=Chelonia mydas TaxID=8469 RepID=UPI001CA89708|nr:translation initiation factor IF-2-like [Chelonia mydas]